MTVEAIIKQKIRASGPMTVARFMSYALTHPELGYYMRKDPIGAKGDFTTAPEISQIFGEIIGAWLAAQWIAMGKPRTALAEFGPGRGTLISDALRATKKIPGFHDAISVHLVEASPTLKQKQWNTLAGLHPDIQWHDDTTELPEKPLLFIANEFFDALPIRQYVYLQDGWHERMVTLKGDKLTFTIEADAGRMVERCEIGKEWAAQIAKLMMPYGGAGLIIDYGYDGPPKNSKETLQAVRNHKYCNILSKPGTADLTAHVDFHALRQAAIEEGVAGYDIMTQADFLHRLGAKERLKKLTEKATKAQKTALISGLKRLTSAKEMGELFKVLCLTHPNHPKPEPF